MQITNKYTITLIVVFISLFHKAFAQQRTDIIANIQQVIINNKQSFVNNPVNEIINKLSFPIEGYSINLKLMSSIEDTKISSVNFYFLPKKKEIDDALKGEITNNTTVEKIIILTVYIKNYQDFSLVNNQFYNSTGSNNWNDSIKSTFLSSGIIVENVELFSN